ncbi:MAG: hemerythrin domain-containing protein [Deltaproteobacteria bacterium]|nr:hemerythrin domain-containing protein [Deltaproteobacteria bacterium]
MPDFMWKDDYSVGVEILDRQHKYLFDKVRVVSELKLDEAKMFISDLYQYFVQHCAAEEAHMAAIGFPELENHRKLHERLVEQLDTVATNFKPDARTILKLKLFYFEMLTSHILKEDKKYFNFNRMRLTRAKAEEKFLET